MPTARVSGLVVRSDTLPVRQPLLPCQNQTQPADRPIWKLKCATWSRHLLHTVAAGPAWRQETDSALRDCGGTSLVGTCVESFQCGIILLGILLVRCFELHIPQGCTVRNIQIKKKLARLRHQQQVLQRHLQELEESPNPDPSAIEQHHRKYNNFLRYYSSWDNAYSQQQENHPQQQHRLHHQEEHSYHQQAMQTTSHPRRWFKKRSKDNVEQKEKLAPSSSAAEAPKQQQQDA
ncbi:hypothetical protein RP20_CCG013208 [Aedes albopictus]|nr:hypothetical protein RP20_CCG013208 [Aedes albopictus]